MSTRPRLTTTSYTLLGLLALRDWTTYELVGQMQRTIRLFWPRAESKIYEEPRKLVAHGFATATKRFEGRRPHTLYAITARGRRALTEWLAEPGKAPVLEFDGLVHVLFAEQGTKQQLVATLRAARADAEHTKASLAAIGRELSETGGPFPDRLHVNALVFRFLTDHVETVERWAAWAEQEVERWPDDIKTVPGRRRVFEGILGR